MSGSGVRVTALVTARVPLGSRLGSTGGRVVSGA